MLALRTLAIALPALMAPLVPSRPDGADPADSPSVMAISPVTAPASAAEAMGPPWISIEYPVNPYDATTRQAFLLVHAFHHGTPTAFPVSGTAEGIVNGERKSIALRFTATSRTGAYALTKQWPNDGTWTLVVSVAQGPDDKVSAIVALGPSGDVASIRVPTQQRNGWTVPAAVAMTEVEMSLRQRAAQHSAAR